MRVLLLLSESWNDNLHPNNNLTNWFQGFDDLEIWTVSGSSYPPNNDVCKRYFVLDEKMMLNSLFSRTRNGKLLYYETHPKNEVCVKDVPLVHLSFLKENAGELLRLGRDFVWRFGHYNLPLLQQFIEQCNPDIVFSQRRGSVKMCRMEHLVMRYTSAPLVVYTGDDDFSLMQYSLNPIYWVRRLWTRKWIRKMAPFYSLLYCQSKRQMNEYAQVFGLRTKFLVKCGYFREDCVHSEIGDPIRITYAGKLYCNRWKTLALIAETIGEINANYDNARLYLEIYTRDTVTTHQRRLLDDGYNSKLMGPVDSEKLLGIYSKTDILLHVEGLDKKNRLLTKDSFSTKVIDCLSSGASVLAVCWENHAALQYLREQDAAFTANGKAELKAILQKIVSNPSLIQEYSKRAYQCGINHHDRAKVQDMLRKDFKHLIEKSLP